MAKSRKEKRKYQRCDTEVKVYFRVAYDIKTRIRFQLIGTKTQRRISRKYSGVSKNISAEGMCFVSRKKLEIGDMLLLEVHIPSAKVPVRAEGEVIWSKRLSQEPKYRNIFYTGVILSSVNGRTVADSIYYDKEYKLVWSAVLESVFGSFKAAVNKIK